jgi:endonuclease YncB( thermonuclease family)
VERALPGKLLAEVPGASATLGAMADARRQRPRRSSRPPRAVAAACAVGAALAWVAACAPAPSRAQTITGTATVHDGDTLSVGAVRVRVFAIDAPELAQSCRAEDGSSYACGEEARRVLAARVGQEVVTCVGRTRDRYGRVVARCSVGAEDLGAMMVREGWALAYRAFGDDYVEAEREARVARRGLWRGSFEPPWEWRRRNPAAPEGPAADRRPPSAAAASPDGPRSPPGPRAPPESEPPAAQTHRPGAPEARCVLKGNVSRRGERIYHRPGQRDYARTRIDPDRGERWFCSEAEARAAGFRPARE